MAEKIEIPDWAFRKLNKMLFRSGLSVRSAYRPREVCSILEISYRQFQRMSDFEKFDGAVPPGKLDSFRIGGVRGEKRVDYDELARFLWLNNTYELAYGDMDVLRPMEQLDLF